MGQVLELICLKEDKNIIRINKENYRESRQPFKRINNNTNQQTNNYQKNDNKNQQLNQQLSEQVLESNNSEQKLTIQKTESDFLIQADSMYFAGDDLITSFLKNKLQKMNTKTIQSLNKKQKSETVDILEEDEVESLMVKNSFFNYIDTQEQKNQKLSEYNDDNENLKIIQSYLDSFVQKVIQETKENEEKDIDEQFLKRSIHQAISKQESQIGEKHYNKLKEFLLQNQFVSDKKYSQQYIDNYLYLATKYSLTASLFQKMQRDSERSNHQLQLY